ncbi:MAG TPA: ribonuclease Z [archaeon]|nr:ribonuclease Z [archaeon]
MPLPLEIFFLGTGSSIPSEKRMQAAYVLRRGADVFLFDCGESAQLGLQKQNISPLKISKIFISHWHADHFAGLLPLIETMHLLDRKNPLEIYAPEASRFIDGIVELSYYGIGFEIRAIDCDIEQKQKLFENSEYEIFSTPVKHSVPACGFVFSEKPHVKIDIKLAKKFGLEIGPQLSELKLKGSLKIKNKTINLSEISKISLGRKFAYSGDCLPTEEFFRAAAGADLLIHDGTFIEAVEGRAHSAVADVAALAKEYSVKKLALVHLSRRYKDTKETLAAAKKVFKNSIVGKDGMKVIL